MGAPAVEPTEIRVAYDDRALYIAVRARDSRPDGIVARHRQRDQIARTESIRQGFRYGGDDLVLVMLDPFHDRRAAYVFGTNPNGAEFDALVSNDGQDANLDWWGVWQVAAARTADGWSAEFTIPFRSIRYPVGSRAPWGFNVVRFTARTNEESLWTSWSRDNEGFHRVSLAGHLEGLDALPRPGLSLEAKPYLLGGGTRTVDGALRTTDGTVEAGLDLKWQLTPGLLLDLTANTDFAQVEADDERVNLTRFSLFYPEKREFFLENAGIFELGWRGSFEPPPFQLFFSRRIGLADEGAVPLLGGLRLTGRAGRQSIGVLNVVTEPAFAAPRTNHAVVRVRRDVGGAGFLGAMVTDQRSEAGANTAAGVDWLARATPTLTFSGFAAGTRNSDGTGRGAAARALADYSSDRWAASASHLYVGRDAVAGLGFVTRTGIHRTDLNLGATPRPGALGIRRMEVALFAQRIGDEDGRTVDLQVGPSVNPVWGDGSRIYVWYVKGFTRLDQGFTLSDRIAVPAARYDFWQTGLYGSTSPSRPLVGRAEITLQGIYGGTLHSLGGTATLAPTPGVELVARLTRNLADLPGGHFTADVGSFRLALAASTRLAANILVQYNSLDRTVAGNLRIRYTYRPGSDLFLVLNEQRGDGGRLWAAGDRAALAKLTWLFRF